MYYNDIVEVIRKANTTSFVCEMINGNETEFELEVLEDSFTPVPIYAGSKNEGLPEVLPWFIARDILSIRPAKLRLSWGE